MHEMAMREADAHLSDEALVLLGDEESRSRGTHAVRHLATCARCQQRANELAADAAEFAAWYHDDAEAASDLHARSRLALSAQLQQVAAERARPWGRLREALAPGLFWAPPLAAAVILTLWVAGRPARPAPPIGGHDFDARALPIASITPGAVRAVRLDALCAERPDAPPIPAEMRHQVLADYEMLAVPADQYELDYLITPELGGATDSRNLWPQRYSDRTWNALVKDEIELLLPRLVCSQQVDLAVAQRDIARDWIAAYKKYFGTSEPRRIDRAGRLDDEGPGGGFGPPAGPAPALLRLASLRSGSRP